MFASIHRQLQLLSDGQEAQLCTVLRAGKLSDHTETVVVYEGFSPGR